MHICDFVVSEINKIFIIRPIYFFLIKLNFCPDHIAKDSSELVGFNSPQSDFGVRQQDKKIGP